MTLGYLLSTRHVAFGIPLVVWGGLVLMMTVGVCDFALQSSTPARTILRLSALLVGLGLGMVAIGAVGQAQLTSHWDSVAAQVLPDGGHVHLSRMVKFHEQACLALGGLLGLLPVCAGVALVGRGLSRLERFRE